MNHKCEITDLEFRNRENGSYQRTENAGMIVQPCGKFRWDVTITDSKRPHTTYLFYDRGQIRGTCDCRGFKYQHGPCAHLWAIWRAAEFGTAKISKLEDAIGGEPCCPMCGQIPPEAEVP